MEFFFIIFLLTLSPLIYVLDTRKIPPKTVSSEENLAYLLYFCNKNCALMNHSGNEQDYYFDIWYLRVFREQMFPLWRWLAAPRPSNPKASDLAQPWCRFWGQWSVWNAATKNSQLWHQSGWGFEPWDLLNVWPLACNLISQEFFFPIWKTERKYLNFRVSMKIKIIHRGFPGGPVVKNPPANSGDTGSIPGTGSAHNLTGS